MAKRENDEGSDKVAAIIVTSWCKITLNSVAPAQKIMENMIQIWNKYRYKYRYKYWYNTDTNTDNNKDTNTDKN